MPNSSPYSPSAQNPSYGSGGFNGTSAGSFSPATGAAAGVPSVNYTVVAGGSAVLAAAMPGTTMGASSKPPGEIGFVNGDIRLVFNCIENGQALRAEFAPEHDFSALDSTRVVLIVQMLSMGADITGENLMQYIRKYSLERHFKFTV